MKNHKKSLADPRWQKKRLEILQRDKWKCIECGRDDLELHVHHLNYSNEPWESKNEDLKTVCYNCHCIIHTGINFIHFKKFVRQKYGAVL